MAFRRDILEQLGYLYFPQISWINTTSQNNEISIFVL